jgi:hypothetical protein
MIPCSRTLLEMRVFPIFAFLSLVLTPNLLAQNVASSGDKLWTWFGDCSERRGIELEVLIGGKRIYKSSFPICPISDISQETRKTVVFNFNSEHTFQSEYHTTRMQSIEGNIWQAGADSGVILLGISFSTKHQVLLNTIHFAKLDRESSTEIDRGIIVRTFPMDRK